MIAIELIMFPIFCMNCCTKLQEFYLIYSHFEQALKSDCLCFSKALSLAGKKIQLRPKCGAICELMAPMSANQTVRITRDFKMDVIEKNIN